MKNLKNKSLIVFLSSFLFTLDASASLDIKIISKVFAKLFGKTSVRMYQTLDARLPGIARWDSADNTYHHMNPHLITKKEGDLRRCYTLRKTERISWGKREVTTHEDPKGFVVAIDIVDSFGTPKYLAHVCSPHLIEEYHTADQLYQLVENAINNKLFISFKLLN